MRLLTLSLSLTSDSLSSTTLATVAAVGIHSLRLSLHEVKKKMFVRSSRHHVLPSVKADLPPPLVTRSRFFSGRYTFVKLLRRHTSVVVLKELCRSLLAPCVYLYHSP